jgi:hypothetical protein
MPFETLNEIILKTDFEAKDITIINYNETLAQIKAYLSGINNNVNFIKNVTVRDEEMLPLIHYGISQPSQSKVEEGDLWLQPLEE